MGIATSGFVASIASLPFDVVRIRMVTDLVRSGPLRSASFFDAISLIIEDKGFVNIATKEGFIDALFSRVMGLYAGLVAKSLRASLYGVSSFVAAWGLERWFGIDPEHSS